MVGVNPAGNLDDRVVVVLGLLRRAVDPQVVLPLLLVQVHQHLLLQLVQVIVNAQGVVVSVQSAYQRLYWLYSETYV